MPDFGVLTKSNVDERLEMFACSHAYRVSSTLEQRLRISSALIRHFFLSAVYITRKLGQNNDVFITRDRDFLNQQNPNFLSFGQTHLLATKQKFTDDVIFSPTDMLTGCPLDAKNRHQVSSV